MMRWRSLGQFVLVTIMSVALSACAAKRGGGKVQMVKAQGVMSIPQAMEWELSTEFSLNLMRRQSLLGLHRY